MTHWLVVVPAERHLTELMYHHEAVELPVEPAGVLAVGDDVALAAGEPLGVFGLGRVVGRTDPDTDPDDPDAPEPGDGTAELVSVRYTHRLLDAPVAVNLDAPVAGNLDAPVAGNLDAPVAGNLDAPVAGNGATSPRPGHPQRLDAAGFAALAAQVGAEYAVSAPRTRWLVGVDLPIEATSPAEAVRLFWTYVSELGPSELPAFVAPADDELAMQAYVFGEEANLDPEEEEDE